MIKGKSLNAVRIKLILNMTFQNQNYILEFLNLLISKEMII